MKKYRANLRKRQYLADDFQAENQEQVRAILDDLLQNPPRDFTSAARWFGLFSETSTAISEVHSELEIATQTNTAIPEHEARLRRFDENILSQLLRVRGDLMNIYLNSPWRGSMHADDRGRIVRDFVQRSRYALKELADLQIEENQIVRDYRRTMARAQTVFAGHTAPVSVIVGKLQDHNPRMRKEAFLAYWGYVYEHEEMLQDYFSRLLKNRAEQARVAGAGSYIPLAFAELGRLDYTAEDCGKIRESIAKVLCPILQEITPYQMRSVRSASLRPWDMNVCQSLLPQGLPGNGNLASILDAAQRICAKLHPCFGELFAKMRSDGLIDIEPRPHKAPGAFCITFQESGIPYIFGNFAGNMRDALTLFHEFGHAVHGHASSFVHNVLMRSPGLEFCEVASMSFEMLAAHHFSELWEDPIDARKAQGFQLFNMLVFWPFMAMIDSWQHQVYSLQASPSERNQIWKDLSRKYRPDVDWSGLEHFESLGWCSRPHVFTSPFYYIDYGIAQLGAAQLWQQSLQNHEQAIAHYIYSISLGAQRSLPELFAAGGMSLDFSGEILAQVARQIGDGVLAILNRKPNQKSRKDAL